MQVFIAVFLLGFLISLLALTNKKMLFLYILTFTLTLQNISTMILLKTELISMNNGKYLLYLKEIILSLSIIFLGLKRLITQTLKINTIDSLVIIYLLYISFLLLAEISIPLEVRLAGFRSLFLLPALYLLGRWIYWNHFDAKQIISFLVIVSIFIAIFGLIEAYIFPQDFWILIGQEEYYLMKEGRPIKGLLYGNMYYWDFGKPIRRVASIVGDPLITSFTLLYSILLLVCWMSYVRPIKLRKGHLFLMIISLTLLLTFGRGAILALLSGVSIFTLSFNVFSFVILITVSLLLVISFTLLYSDVILGVVTGVSHVQGLQSGLSQGIYNPMGMGIGMSSNIAKNMYQAITGVRTEVGGDSYMGSVSAQIGIIGVILLYGFLLILTIRLYSIYRAFYSRNQSRSLYIKTLLAATTMMLTGIILTSTLSESATSFVGSGIVFIMAGILISVHSIEQNKQT